MITPHRPPSDFRRADGTEPLILISLRGAAALVGVSYSTIKRKVAAHEIASIQVGRLRRVPISSLHKWVERLEAAQGTQEALTASETGETHGEQRKGQEAANRE